MRLTEAPSRAISQQQTIFYKLYTTNRIRSIPKILTFALNDLSNLRKTDTVDIYLLIIKSMVNHYMKALVGLIFIIGIAWAGVTSLTAALDHYGFGPNTPTRNDIIKKNIQRLDNE